MNTPPSQKKSSSAARKSSAFVAVLGAVFIHPVVFSFACLKGFFFGASVPMTPTPALEYGLEGSLASFVQVLFVYAVTLGLVPVLVSLMGAVIGMTLPKRFLKSRSSSVSRSASADDPSLLQSKQALDETARAELDAFLAAESSLHFPETDSPQVSVVIALYNRAELTLRCLQSLINQTDVEFDVILIDNASTDRTADLLDRISGVHIIRNGENLGYVRGVNLGAKHARGEFLLLLNNDTELKSSAMSIARQNLKDDMLVGAVGARLTLPNGTLQEAGCWIEGDGRVHGFGRGRPSEDLSDTVRKTVDFCSAAFLMLRRADFETLDGFDEQFSPGYYEDVDLCVRLQQIGLSVIYDPRIAVMHYEFGSQSANHSARELIKEHRNKFCAKHKVWLAQFRSASKSKKVRRGK